MGVGWGGSEEIEQENPGARHRTSGGRGEGGFVKAPTRAQVKPRKRRRRREVRRK